MQHLSRRRARWFIVTIVLVGAVLRLSTVHFGLPALNDPDELTFELGAVRLLRGPTLNPGWFGHPATTTFYALAFVDVGVFLLGWLNGWFASPGAFAKAIYLDPSWVILPGRIMIVLFSLLVIWLTYLLGAKLFDRRSGLAAAAMLALSPVHVTWSQIIRADMMASAFMLLAMLAALQVARTGRWCDTLSAAGWLALATASKWPFAVAALAMAGAASLRWANCPRAWRTESKRLALFAACSLLGLFAVSPYLFFDYRKAISDILGEAQQYHLGATGGSFGWNLAWYLSSPLLSSFGIAGLCLVAAGLLLFARHREARAIILPIVIMLMAVLAAQHVVWDRWVLPLLPLLALAAGHSAVWIYDRGTRLLKPRAELGIALVFAAVIATPLITTNTARARERMHDTRQQATNWLLAHAPRGSRVMIEQFSFDLVGKGYDLIFPVGDAGCLSVEKGLGGQVSLSTVTHLHAGRTNIDYGTLAPGKVSTCAADFAIVTQYDRYAAERSRFPRETAQYEALIARGRTLAVFSPVPGQTGGPIVRILAFKRD